MSENEFDTNIDNYTIEDLLDILNLSVDYDEEQIKKVTNNIIDKFTEENKANEVKFSAKTASSKKYAETQFKNAERRLENANKYYDRLLVTVGKREKTLADLKARLQKSKSK